MRATVVLGLFLVISLALFSVQVRCDDNNDDHDDRNDRDLDDTRSRNVSHGNRTDIRDTDRNDDDHDDNDDDDRVHGTAGNARNLTSTPSAITTTPLPTVGASTPTRSGDETSGATNVTDRDRGSERDRERERERERERPVPPTASTEGDKESKDLDLYEHLYKTMPQISNITSSYHVYLLAEHHKKANAMLEMASKNPKWREAVDKYWGPSFASNGMANLLRNLNKLPEELRNSFRRDGAFFVNHMFFFSILRKARDANRPAEDGALMKQINSQYGSFEKFKDKVNEVCNKVFGSGWCWVVISDDASTGASSSISSSSPSSPSSPSSSSTPSSPRSSRSMTPHAAINTNQNVPNQITSSGDKKFKLSIGTTHNEDTPIMNNKKVLFGLDMWEHAWMLDYPVNRPEYVDNLWKLLNWDVIEKHLKNVLEARSSNDLLMHSVPSANITSPLGDTTRTGALNQPNY